MGKPGTPLIIWIYGDRFLKRGKKQLVWFVKDYPFFAPQVSIRLLQIYLDRGKDVR